MFTLQISYPVRDSDAFKNVFDSDPAGRADRFLSVLDPYHRHYGAGCSADPESEDTSGCGVGSVAGAGSGLWPVSGATSAGVLSLGAPAPGTAVPVEPLSAPLGLPSVVRPSTLLAPSSTFAGTCSTCPGPSFTSLVDASVLSGAVGVPLSAVPSVVVGPVAPPSMLDADETRLEMGLLVPNSTAVTPTIAITNAAALTAPTLIQVFGVNCLLSRLARGSSLSAGALAASTSPSSAGSPPLRRFGIFVNATLAAELSVRA